MKISTKGTYGLEALVDLALHESEGPVSLKNIAERGGFSEAYILQIFLVLRRADIVTSIRGSQGGYTLSRSPSEISVGDVLEALEGPLAPVSCIIKDCKNPCNRYDRCVTRNLWERIMGELSMLSRSISIADLVHSYYEINLNRHHKSDYSI